MRSIAVVAINIGTTYSGWANSFYHEFERNPVTISLRNWVAGQRLSNKAPTCVLIKPDGKTLDSFGFEAENKYGDLALEDSHKDWYFFQRFTKMIFNRMENEHNTLLEDSSGKRLSARKVLTLLIQYLKDDSVQQLNRKIAGDTLKTSEIHWVFTAPAISYVAKQLMRGAAEDAGIPRENITIVSEPQGASVFCKYLPPEKFVGRDKTSLAELKTGTKYILLDAGGTSVKFIVHEILSVNKVKELLSSGIDCGGTSVDEEFENFLGEIFGKAVISSLKDLSESEDIWELFRDFEIQKRSYVCNKAGKIVVRIPVTIIDLVAQKVRKNMRECVEKSRYKNSVSVHNDKLRIDAQVMRSFYENVVTDIIRHVETLLKNPLVSDCYAIVMVGGFSESKLLQESIQKEFIGLKIIIPEEAGVAVLQGAVILGHNPLALDVQRTASEQSMAVTKPYTPQYGMGRKFRASEQSGPVRVPALPPRDKMNRNPNVSMKSLNVTNADLPCYKMDRTPRGWCIIINVENFDDNNARTGTQHDKDRLLVVFGNLHFIVVCYDNLTSTEIMKQLVNASTNIDHSEFDCFVCCILSHGSLGHVYGSDGRAVPIKEITSTFNAYRCPTLAGKPKLFFMQACQGKDVMPGASSIETDSFREESIPLEADFLYGYSTVPGHVAYRRTESGSWYMQALCDSLKKLHNSCHLLEILTEVNRKVAEESSEQHGGIYKQIPAPQNTLRKKIYFR